MKNILIFISLFTMATTQAQIRYPVTEKRTVTDDYFGTKVEDPYRWLEDDNASDTKNWVVEQNKVTDAYLAKIPFRDSIFERLKALWNYPKYEAPFKKGDWYYFYKNDGLQNQSVLYRTKTPNDTPEVFLDPNSMSTEGIVALSGLSFSKNGQLCTYALSKAGSDWSEIFVMDVQSKELLKDTIKWTKFGGASWLGEEGFFYSGYDEPDEQSKLSKANEFQKVYYHKIGTPQNQDSLVYEDKDHPKRYVRARLTEDERFLILNISEGTSGGELWYHDRQNSAQKKFTLLVKGFDTESDVVDNDGNKLIVQTNFDAPNYRVVIVDPEHPERENWKTIIPEQKEVLLGVGTGGGQLFTSYLKDASSRVYQHDYNGKKIREIELPGIGSAGGFGAEKEDQEFYYSFSSFAFAPAVYKYTIASGESELFKKTEIKMNTDGIVTEQKFFTSTDGTKVPMFLTYKKGMKREGNNPVLLYGYGGFNIPMTPTFNVSNAFFVEQGGIYVVANLRGGSNGGLLVGAAMTQRPDLFKVAIPQVGVLDMLRYHKFTVGWGWAVEYGSADSSKYFPYLYKYSPYHNLKRGVSYPATMITTGDHDDRVVPAHSFKFAARLQEYNKGKDPMLIRIETNAGHGAGKPTTKMIDEAADIWAFIMYNLEMNYRE